MARILSAPFWQLQELKLGTLGIRRDGKANQALLHVPVVPRAKFRCMLNPRLWLLKGWVFVVEFGICHFSRVELHGVILGSAERLPLESWGLIKFS